MYTIMELESCRLSYRSLVILTLSAVVALGASPGTSCQPLSTPTQASLVHWPTNVAFIYDSQAYEIAASWSPVEGVLLSIECVTSVGPHNTMF